MLMQLKNAQNITKIVFVIMDLSEKKKRVLDIHEL